MKIIISPQDNNMCFLSLRVIAYGPGIEPFGPIVGSPANFTVETLAAGKGLIHTEN